MKALIFILVLVINICPDFIPQQRFPSYFEVNDFSLASTGAFKFGLYGYANPAVLTYLHQPDLYFTWNDKNGDSNDFSNWGLFAAVPNFSFSMVSFSDKDYSIKDYKFSAGVGGPDLSLGLGYSWSGGDLEYFDRSQEFTLGSLFRFNRYSSVGLVLNLPVNSEREGIVDLALRPFGNEFLTLFGDYVFTNDEIRKKVRWSAGAVLEPLDGIRLTGRYFEGKSFNLGTQISFGNIGLSYQSHFDSEKNHAYNTYGIRAGGYDRNIFARLLSPRKFVELNLNGALKYQRYRLFDDSNTLIDLLTSIDAAMRDNTVRGIAVNLSGMNFNREMMWELRQKLHEFKNTGKKIVVYADRLNIDGYHLASVADRIILDPLGSVSLEGYVLGRTFYKGALEKLGIGITELRYFKYKSAAESLSKDKMSEADREQRQRLVDEFYRIAKTDICDSRNISSGTFEMLVNEMALFSSAEALENKLVDTLGRWNDVQRVIVELNRTDARLVSAGSLEAFNLPIDNKWSSKPVIAVIYAIGGTQMDEGIKARSLVKYVQSAVENNNVKAIVLRVDSPGGDGLASDLIAEALKKAKGKKPVIVSQGYVAASGGYWLSMYADTIVAAPNTITGSIGVIGVWVYNTELKDKLGLSTDNVKVGRYSDLNFGATIPLLGLTIPDRDLNNDELRKAENLIRNMYKDFVSKVASGRNMSFDAVNEIGEGRVWSGADGLANGLVDVLGGLDTAIKIAVARAGLNYYDYEIVEMPERPLIDLSRFIPSLVPGFLSFDDDPFINDLKLRLLNNGFPMPLLPLDFINTEMVFQRF